MKSPGWGRACTRASRRFVGAIAATLIVIAILEIVLRIGMSVAHGGSQYYLFYGFHGLVGRLGISHARAQQIAWEQILYDPKGPDSLMAKLDDRRAELYYTPSPYGTSLRGNQFGGMGGRRGQMAGGFGAGAGFGAGMGLDPVDMMSAMGNYGGGFGGGMRSGAMGRPGRTTPGSALQNRGFQSRSPLGSRPGVVGSRAGLGRAGQGMGTYGQPAYGAPDPTTGVPYGELPEGMEYIYETQFFVEFVWKRTELENRFATREEAAAAAPEPTEDAAGTGMDEMGMGLDEYYGM